MKTSLLPILSAMRLHNGLACALLFLAGYTYGGQTVTPQMIVAGLAVALLCVVAHLVNDLVDLPADRHNRPERPLPSGRVRTQTVRKVGLACWGIGLALGLWAAPTAVGWWVFWALAGPGYSLIAKGRGWLAPMWTAAVIASCWLAGGWSSWDTNGSWSTAGQSPIHWVVFGLALYYLVFRELVKTLSDVSGDLAAGYGSVVGRFPGNRWGVIVLAQPLILVAGWLIMQPNQPWLQGAAVLFLGMIIGAIVTFGSRRRHHLSGSLLKAGAFLALACLWLYGCH